MQLTQEQEEKLLNRAVFQLMEHFETVHIFVSVTRKPSGTTTGIQKGAGNWYARRGQVSDWLSCEDEYARAHIRSEISDTDDDGYEGEFN